MESNFNMITLSDFDRSSSFHAKKRKWAAFGFLAISTCLIIALTSSLFNSPQIEKISAKDVEGQISAGDLLAWNPTLDPRPTSGDCTQFVYNVILLFNRSPEYLATLSLDQLTEFKNGVKDMFDQLSVFAQARSGKAHVILGAYATYNVWQNMPEARQRGEHSPGDPWVVEDETTWRESINIANPAALTQLKSDFDNIYSTNSSNGNSFDNSLPTRAHLGYTGGEPSRDFWASTYPNNNDPRHRGWGFDNLNEALVQSAREISRWSGGATTVAENQDIDLVLALTSGQPNLNNGRDLFPSRAGFENNPPSNLWTESLRTRPLFTTPPTNWYDNLSGPDDIFRSADIVSKIRSGASLGQSYIDPNAGTPNQLKDSVPAYDGARPPARVFGQAIISRDPYNFGRSFPISLVANEFLHMAQIFGEEYKDYSPYGLPNPPTGKHRHWDKTVGGIKAGEILSDMTLSLFDAGCGTPSTVNVSITAEPDPNNANPTINEGETGMVNAVIRNNGDVPLKNIHITINGTLAPYMETYQREKECIFQLFTITYQYSCHETVTRQAGYHYVGGTTIAVIDRLDPGPGSAYPFTYTVSTQLGDSSDQFPVQAWAQGIYDITTQTPVAGPNKAYGYTWGSIDVGFKINRKSLPA